MARRSVVFGTQGGQSITVLIGHIVSVGRMTPDKCIVQLTNGKEAIVDMEYEDVLREAGLFDTAVAAGHIAP